MFSGNSGSSIKRAIAVCEAVADGDLEARLINITEKGDMGRLMHAINRLIDRSDAYVRESKASLDYVAANKYFRRISETGMTGAFKEASQSMNRSMDTMEERVTSFRTVTSDFEAKMQLATDAVLSAAETMDDSATTMSSYSRASEEQAVSASTAAEEASENVSSVADATGELTLSVGEITQQVVLCSDITSEAVSEIETTRQGINALSEVSTKIGQVVSLINDIADQTNLLALNATIEAARAGEAGRGFSVVAAEVKDLASQTAKATTEISAQITDIQNASANAVTSIETIGTTIEKIDDVTSKISSAVEQQSAMTKEISGNINQASDGTNNVSSNMQSISDAIKETNSTAAVVLDASKELSQKGDEMRSEISVYLNEVKKVV